MADLTNDPTVPLISPQSPRRNEEGDDEGVMGYGGPTHHRPPGEPGHIRTLGLWPLVTLIFFEVSGGPFGTEDAVSAAGPLLTILGFLVFPILWSVPEALITAELATAFPENSGYVAWVTAAFGPFWGFQEGLWSWLSGVTDNSLYPVMLAANLEIFFPQLKEGWPKYVFLVGMSLLLSGLNFRGLTVVGNAVITSTLAILVPFALLCVLCLPRLQVSNYTQVDWYNVNWPTFLNVMFWNLNYWDSVSTLAGEVRDPGRTFPRALLLAVVLVVAMYLLPTLAALGVQGATGDWKLGYYGMVAQQVGGSWLAVWIIVAAACSQVGQYQAEMASDSYQVQGMAERGFLPRALGRRSRYGTPVYGILLSSLGVLCLAYKSFEEIVTMLNAIYCLAELLEFAAFVWLRIKRPDLPRPYRVPLPTWGLVLMLLPASALLLVVLAMPFVNRDWETMGWTAGAVALGFVMHPALQFAKKRGWMAFDEMHFDCANVYDEHSGDVHPYGGSGGNGCAQGLLAAAPPAGACETNGHGAVVVVANGIKDCHHTHGKDTGTDTGPA
ncbi:hypothetical protein PLESTB_001574500 [Pleodorina starrii]|uniref:Uncharacterized protein n=1 Tax=Pleodorina starrii TaxID=330485 RepID=A0A9W6F8W2_9CHLO|nr:hypothetical protein PLESTM_000879900 [Pleodorina starrii]GLC60105.1 hypothetical protein PLESTB_001574500 [Pleodorina starrii]GLC68995.1 hypothetical protein PLESTF_000767500 [Pleodorina starrii]